MTTIAAFRRKKICRKRVIMLTLRSKPRLHRQLTQKKTMLRNIASTTRQKLLNSTPLVPYLTQTLGKSILKNRYPVPSIRGQLPFFLDVHSHNFQFNQTFNDTESTLLPPNLEILPRDLFDNPNTTLDIAYHLIEQWQQD